MNCVTPKALVDFEDYQTLIWLKNTVRNFILLSFQSEFSLTNITYAINKLSP